MLKVPSQIHKIETMEDGSLNLIIYTQELHAEDEAEVMRLKRKLGTFVFAVGETITEKDIPEIKIEFPNEKSPSQRLRNVLFIAWQQDTAGYKDFDLYYKNKMEKFISHIKERLV